MSEASPSVGVAAQLLHKVACTNFSLPWEGEVAQRSCGGGVVKETIPQSSHTRRQLPLHKGALKIKWCRNAPGDAAHLPTKEPV